MESQTWRIIVDCPASGAHNMAADEALLRVADSAPAEFTPTLRFYAWDPPAVSIGYGQRARDFETRTFARENYGFVRRLTGGGALFHFQEMTFSFVSSLHDDALPPDTGKVYSLINRGLIAGLNKLGVDAQARGCGDSCRQEQAAFCTVRTSPYDIVVGGRKLMGTAQRWTKRVVLEHGFLPLEPNPLTPEILSLNQVLNRPIAFSEVVPAISAGFQQAFQIHLETGDYSDEESRQLQQLRLKYASEEWNYRR